MKKTIILNGYVKDCDKINVEDIILYISNEHPEDKADFAKAVFEKSSVYNHFKARKIFFKRYFPEVYEKEDVILPSDEIKNWLLEERIEK